MYFGELNLFPLLALKWGVADLRYEIQVVENFQPKQELKLYLFLPLKSPKNS